MSALRVGHSAASCCDDTYLVEQTGGMKKRQSDMLAGCCVYCFSAFIDRGRSSAPGLSGLGVRRREGLAWIGGAGMTTPLWKRKK